MRTDILLNKAVGVCWDPLTVKFSGVFNCICSKAVVSEPWPKFLNQFCWNCHNCLLFESRITGQNREYSSVKNDECKRDRTLFEQRHHCDLALFSWSTIGREIHVICVCSGVVWHLSPHAVCGHSRGKNRKHLYYVSLHILHEISWPFFQEALTAHKVYS